MINNNYSNVTFSKQIHYSPRLKILSKDDEKLLLELPKNMFDSQLYISSHTVISNENCKKIKNRKFEKMFTEKYNYSHVSSDILEIDLEQFSTGKVYFAIVNDFEDIADYDEERVIKVEIPKNNKLLLAKKTIELYRNYPNPFNPRTTISFYLNEEAKVNLSIYNLKGELVKVLAKSRYQSGLHNIIWDGSNLHEQKVASGVYLYRLSVNKIVFSKYMILMK